MVVKAVLAGELDVGGAEQEDIANIYDAISEGYDKAYASSECLLEENMIIAALKYEGFFDGGILDVGCGTGLLLDYTSPDRYLGIDPSEGMLVNLSAKHPNAETVKSTFKDYYPTHDWDAYPNVVALFGSISYESAEEVQNLIDTIPQEGKVFLMLPVQGHAPTYAPTHPMVKAADINCSISASLNNYDIVLIRGTE